MKNRAISRVGLDLEEETFEDMKKISDSHALYLINADKGRA